MGPYIRILLHFITTIKHPQVFNQGSTNHITHRFMFSSVTTFQPLSLHPLHRFSPYYNQQIQSLSQRFCPYISFLTISHEESLSPFPTFFYILSSRNHTRKKIHLQEHLLPYLTHFYASIIAIILAYRRKLSNQPTICSLMSIHFLASQHIKLYSTLLNLLTYDR